LYASFGTSTGVPCDVIPTIFNQGWGDWSLGSDLRAAQIASTVWARGARLFLGDRLHPQGRATPETKRTLKAFQRLRAEISTLSPPADATPAPDVLILHSTSITYGDEMESFGDNPKSRLTRLQGAHHLFLDSGASSWVVAEHALDTWLPRASLVVLPELTKLERATETKLRRFVEKGGQLLLAGSVPALDDKPLDWCGVENGSGVWQDHAYLPAWCAGDLPVLVRGAVHGLRLCGAQGVLPLIAPYDGEANMKYGWGIGPASGEPSEYPALTRFDCGQGTVWICAPPLFTDYARHGNWQQALWWRELLNRLKAPRRAWVEASSGNVELVVWENAQSTFVMLIQHGGEQAVGQWSRSIGPPPQNEVKLYIGARRGSTPTAISLNGRSLEIERTSEPIPCPLSLTQIWNLMRIDWHEGSPAP
jgi:hypothetical protein